MAGYGTDGFGPPRGPWLLRDVRATLRLLGRRGRAWLAASVMGSWVVGGVETAVALFLQLFMVKVGLLDSKAVLPWLREFDEAATMTHLVILLIGIGLVRAAFQFITMHGAIIVRESIVRSLRQRTLARIIFGPWDVRASVAEIGQRFSDIYPRAGEFAYFFTRIAAEAFQIVLLLLAMFYFAPVESAISLVGIGGIGVIALLINRQVRNAVIRAPEFNAGLHRTVERVVKNQVAIRVLGGAAREARGARADIDGYYKANVHAQGLAILGSVLPPLLGIIMMAGLVLVSQAHFNTPPQDFISFIYVFVRFVQKLSVSSFELGLMNSNWGRFQMALHSESEARHEASTGAAYEGATLPGGREAAHEGKARDAEGALSGEDTADSGSDGPRGNASSMWLSRSPPTIVFNGVCFAYASGGRSKCIVKDLSFSLHDGGHLGLQGRSGTGKSTFLLLLLGILRPQAGRVRIGGVDAAAYREDRANRVHYVGPEPFLFAGSIRANLQYGIEVRLADAELWGRLEQVRLGNRIRALPGGLDQELPESQGILSSGERQRLALARAFMARPTLLVLDEATAHLDAASESGIVEELRRLRGACTLVTVSHRPALLEACDVCLDFDQLLRHSDSVT